MNKINLDYYDVEELAASLCGITEEYESDGDSSLVDEALYEQFDISQESLHKLIERLIPMIDVGKGLTGTMYKGFAKDGIMFVKTEVNKI